MLNNLNTEAMKNLKLNIAGNFSLIFMLMMYSVAAPAQTRTLRGRENNTISNRSTQSNVTNRTGSRQERTVVVRPQPEKSQSVRNSYQVKTEDFHPANTNQGNSKSFGHSENHEGYGHSEYHDGYGYHNDHYNQPKTYSVWNFPAPWVYANHAYVFRHSHGDYYFYNNRFFSYDPFRGYYAVTFPYQTIFSWLPAGYDEVMVDGQIYFRYGNLFFVETPVGYRIVPPPAGIYVSINF